MVYKTAEVITFINLCLIWYSFYIYGYAQLYFFYLDSAKLRIRIMDCGLWFFEPLDPIPYFDVLSYNADPQSTIHNPYLDQQHWYKTFFPIV